MDVNYSRNCLRWSLDAAADLVEVLRSFRPIVSGGYRNRANSAVSGSICYQRPNGAIGFAWAVVLIWCFRTRTARGSENGQEQNSNPHSFHQSGNRVVM